MKQILIVVLVMATLKVLVACTVVPAHQAKPPDMANPASVNCTEQGGKTEIRDEASGQVGYCIFPDGSECEEWAFFRGECVPGETTPSSNLPPQETENGQPVVFVQGGAIDDTVSYLLLTTMDDVDLRGVIVTNADTIADYAMQVQWKSMDYIEDTGRPIGLSGARGWNSFPWPYRSDVIRQNNTEVYSGLESNPDWPPYPSGDALLHDLLAVAVERDAPVSILITCPPTTLSDLLREHPELEKGVARLIWMGGAIHVDGNLDPKTIPAEVANPKAEWNAFWDPDGVDWLFQNTSFPIVLFPLDVTDQVPLTENFKDKLERQAVDYRYSDLVHQSYALVGDEPYYEMWNTVTTAYIAHPEFFAEPETMNLAIANDGFEQGAISESVDGREVEVVLDFVDKDAFYDYVLEQFKRSFVHDQIKDGS